jgi:hypothetical protein
MQSADNNVEKRVKALPPVSSTHLQPLLRVLFIIDHNREGRLFSTAEIHPFPPSTKIFRLSTVKLASGTHSFSEFMY